MTRGATAADDEWLAALADRKLRNYYTWTARDQRRFERLANKVGEDTQTAERKALYRKAWLTFIDPDDL